MSITGEKKAITEWSTEIWETRGDSLEIFNIMKNKKHIYRKSGESDTTKVYFYYMTLPFLYK